MKTFTTLAAVALLAATPALAEMEDYDGDADGMLNDAEFGEAEAGKRWTDYDADGDGAVSEEEFAAGEFRRYDSDRDGAISDAEYARYEEDSEAMEGEED